MKIMLLRAIFMSWKTTTFENGLTTCEGLKFEFENCWMETQDGCG